GEAAVRPVLVPALRRRVDVPVDAQELLAAASVGRVGVEDLAGVVPHEDAVAGEILQPRIAVAIVVEGASGRQLIWRERDAEVVVEVRMVRGDPAESPSHARADLLDLVDGRAGNDGIGQIVILQVDENPLEMVDLERAADTLRDLARPQHEMLDEELTAAFEQIRER